MWIYILIILIFVIRGVIKSAEKQRNSARMQTYTTDNEPQQEREYPIYEIPDEILEALKSENRAETRKKAEAAAEVRPAEATERQPATRRTEQPESSKEADGYFSDIEEIRKGIIAAEILNRKY